MIQLYERDEMRICRASTAPIAHDLHIHSLVVFRAASASCVAARSSGLACT
jgi:hypothetical protein